MHIPANTLKISNVRVAWLLVAFAMAIAPLSSINAQECKVDKATLKAYLVTIDGKQLIAVPKEDVAELQMLRNKVTVLEKENAKLIQAGGGVRESSVEYKLQAEKTLAANEREITLLYHTVGLMEKDAALADEQINKLKACCLITPEQNLSFHVGLGATSSDNTEAAALVGVGYGRWRLYGFLQDSNSGLLLGYQF